MRRKPPPHPQNRNHARSTWQDYDRLWDAIKASAPELFMAWRDCGLIDENGKSRPAHSIWRDYLKRPFARAKAQP